MHYYIIFLFLIFYPIKAQDYYETTLNLYGNELRAQLHQLIKNHNSIDYSSCIAALKQTDQAPNNPEQVQLVYKNSSIDEDNFAYDINNPAHLDYWNREHVWPKSLGDFGPNGVFENSPAHSDLHNLKPADMSINSDRSNKCFDNGGFQHTEATECYYSEFSWEAPDNVKGDIARILFYMDIRYEGDDNEPNLSLTEDLNTFPNPQIGKLSTLLEWHIEDPVDAFEINRNNIIFDWQNNRNPFIDHPEYVNMIWGNDSIPSTSNSTPLIISEYIEGSSNNKAIELFNTSSEAISLDDYQLVKISNGGEWYEQSYNLTGEISAFSTYVISHSSAVNEITELSQLQVNLNHNGNDALGLFYQGTLVDQIGNSGEAPSEGWEVAGIESATKNHTLIRKPEIQLGNTIWSNSAGTNTENSEWIVLEQDDFSNLGTHNFNSEINYQTQVIPLGWFILGVNIIPSHASIPDLLESISEQLIICKDYLGNVFLPEYNFNNIDNFEIGNAYQIKSSAQDTLQIEGNPIVFPNTETNIAEGWNLFSYLYPTSNSVNSLVSDFNEEIIIIKDYLGNVYLPDYNYDGIGMLNPGYGYQIKSNTSFTIQW